MKKMDKLLELVDNVKDKINDNEYKNLMDELLVVNSKLQLKLDHLVYRGSILDDHQVESYRLDDKLDNLKEFERLYEEYNEYMNIRNNIDTNKHYWRKYEICVSQILSVIEKKLLLSIEINHI